MQKTKFPLEILIHDDASIDGTEEIIREYEKKYSDIIKPLYEKENQWVLGKKGSVLFNLPRAKGKYIALCEGDDFWTDENKLQKQVDYLEAHPEFSACFHPVRVFFEDGSEKDSIFPTPDFRFNRDIFDLSDLLKHNFIQTNSVLYRNIYGKDIVNVFPKDILPADHFMHLLHAKKGKIGFIDSVMSCYRRHDGGIWWDSHIDKKRLHLKYGVQELNFYLAVENTIAPNKEEYHNITRDCAAHFMDFYIENKEYDKAAEIAKLCPDALSSKCEKIKKMFLFGVIPLGKMQPAKNRTNKAWVKLFGIIPLIKIKW
jgi:glycosyltransferase involved in cell wall biosynthesis